MEIKKQQLAHLPTETKEPILLDHAILLFMEIADSRVRERFGLIINFTFESFWELHSSKGISAEIFPVTEKYYVNKYPHYQSCHETICDSALPDK